MDGTFRENAGERDPGESKAGQCPVAGNVPVVEPFANFRNAFESFRNELPERLDHEMHALVAKTTGGFSPISIVGSFLDWGTHLLFSPGKQMQIVLKAADKAQRLSAYAQRLVYAQVDDTLCIAPLAQDRRFADEAWQQWPFSFIHQQFLLTQQWYHNVFTGVPGVRPQHEALVDFVTRQCLDTLSPSNAWCLNPEVIQRTVDEHGANLVRGYHYFWDDLLRQISGRPPAGHEAFSVGENLATSKGKVIYRNDLLELIQYSSLTDDVQAEPIVIVPAWIMKYYILDLSEENSMVQHLTSQGFTVFMISWKNPTRADRNVGFEGYLKDGVLTALDAVQGAVPDQQVHLVGYCLGGTLSAVAAALLARQRSETLKTLTLLAAQVDFSEAGELSLFISESQLNFLEDLIEDQGFLDKHQMSGAFQMLRSNDLVWSRAMRHYWLGERREPNDLMAWNADATRMPAKMHTEYLRRFYLHNEFATGRFDVCGESVSVSDIDPPIFAVSTTKDHVAPWPSVYKIHLLSDTDVTFVLTSGGHNAGIVSEPGHKGRSYQIRTTVHGSAFKTPQQWEKEAKRVDGSWWPEWTAWLKASSSGTVPSRKPYLIALTNNQLSHAEEAPGTYVFQS